MLRSSLRVPALAALLAGVGAPAAARAEEPPNAIDIAPLAPMTHVYEIHYDRRLTHHGELVTGLAYVDEEFGAGRSHAPGAIIGWRQLLWRGLHVDAELLASYNWFHSSDDAFYPGFELRNEDRVGYTIDFVVSNLAMFVDLDWAIAFTLYGHQSKPDAMRQELEEEHHLLGLPFYNMPQVHTGVRF